ncbi:hypothetical protein BJ912DRAFT_976716 [Pholiota molesta]|nr:hypothetical protein BJ912DRAFT_976716 [Pholiota molesta]
MLSVGSIFARRLLCSLSLSLLILAANGADKQAALCEDGTRAILDHTAVYMGKDTKRWTCNMTVHSNVTSKVGHMKDFDLCTAECTTYCDVPALEGGPDPADCKALATYYADAGRFTIDAHKYIIWEYETCRVSQYNRLDYGEQKISYCFDQRHWAGVVNYVSYHCGSKT